MARGVKTVTHFLDEFSENVDKFFSELGSGSVDDLQEEEEDTDEASDLTVQR